jgi:Holliday junction resolvasome RuvABC endonuclease subunit
MIVIGLDLSLRATGVGLPSGDTTVLSSKQKGIARIIDLKLQVRDILRAALDGSPISGLVVIEDYAFSRANAHAHELGELGGAVKVMLTTSDIAWTTVPPTVLKKFATGRGNADKTAMAVAAVKANGHEFTDDNECDAWWLHTMGMYRFSQEVFGTGALYGVANTAYRDEAVSKVDWPEWVPA